MATTYKKILPFIAFGFFAYIVSRRFTFEASRVLDFEAEKCPFCFSLALCESLPEVSVEISLVDFIVGYINRKYVYFGHYRNRSVVIKRLASEHEVSELDLRIGHLLSENVTLDESYFREACLTLLHPSYTNVDNKLILCPTLANVDFLLERMISREFPSVRVWTLLQLNPEPLILEAFKVKYGWAIPKYIGGCGRIIITENAGRTINAYRNHPWLFRVHVVEQLLTMAYNFTFNNPHFGIYLRDISPENVVVNVNAEVRLVDLEHTIIVDKSTPPENQPTSWDTVHESQHFDCDDCLTYSPMRICSRRISDHNFYAVCKVFLSSTNTEEFGFLHTPSKSDYAVKNADKLRFFVNECIRPSTNVSRLEIAKKFVAFFREMKLLGNFSLSEYKNLI